MSKSVLPQLIGAARIGSNGPHEVTVFMKVVGTPENKPWARRVNLHSQAGGVLLQTRWSDATTGAVTFRGVPAGVCYAAAFDHSGQYNGEIITDIVVPQP